MSELAVYVPVPGSPTTIGRGAGIVGRPLSGQPDIIEVYYEDNRYGTLDYQAEREQRPIYEVCLYHAADRLVTNYPTAARSWIPATVLREVGRFDSATRTLTVTDEMALRRWKDRTT